MLYTLIFKKDELVEKSYFTDYNKVQEAMTNFKLNGYEVILITSAL